MVEVQDLEMILGSFNYLKSVINIWIHGIFFDLVKRGLEHVIGFACGFVTFRVSFIVDLFFEIRCLLEIWAIANPFSNLNEI